MRTNWIKLVFFTFLLIIAPSIVAYAEDCESEDFLDNCAAQITGYKFLKANKVSISGSGGGAVELSSVLSAGSNYIFTACSGGTNMIVSLFDRNKKLIMSNYNKSNKKFYPSITYKCTATGVYYMKYEFENGGSGCGVGIIGFTKI